MNMILDSTKILESVARQESATVPKLDHIIPPKEKRPSKAQLPPSRLDEKTTSKRNLLDKSTSKRGALDKSTSKRGMPDKAASNRALAVAKNAAARFQASKQSYDPVTVPAQVPSPTATCPPTRGVPRVKSMDGTADDMGRLQRRAPPRRNKSTDNVPPTRRSTMMEQRSTSVRRMPSRRSLNLDRSRSERNCSGESTTIPAGATTAMRAAASRLDNSSYSDASGRRRRGPMDDSSTNRRRLPGRSLSNSSGCSQNTAGSVRRRRRTQRESTMRNVPDFDRMDISGGESTAEEEEEVVVEEIEFDHDFEADFSELQKMEDESRRRKEPTLSRMSINDLRSRLQGSADLQQQGPDSSANFEQDDSVWEKGDHPPLADWFTAVATAVTAENRYTDLNDDDYY